MSLIFVRLIEIETQQNVTREDVLRIAESIYDVAHKSVVRLVLKQKQTNPSVSMVHCVRRELVTQRLAELQEMKYTLGMLVKYVSFVSHFVMCQLFYCVCIAATPNVSA